MSIEKKIAALRLKYYLGKVTLVNVCNQLRIINDDKANKLQKRNFANAIDCYKRLGIIKSDVELDF